MGPVGKLRGRLSDSGPTDTLDAVDIFGLSHLTTCHHYKPTPPPHFLLSRPDRRLRWRRCMWGGRRISRLVVGGGLGSAMHVSSSSAMQEDADQYVLLLFLAVERELREG